MERVDINGQMVKNILDNIPWIKNMEEVHFFFQMVINMKECGKMANKMVWVNFIQME